MALDMMERCLDTDHLVQQGLDLCVDWIIITNSIVRIRCLGSRLDLVDHTTIVAVDMDGALAG